jgi:hypothetical protein
MGKERGCNHFGGNCSSADLMKPIIYLYPTTETEVNVKF